MGVDSELFGDETAVVRDAGVQNRLIGRPSSSHSSGVQRKAIERCAQRLVVRKRVRIGQGKPEKPTAGPSAESPQTLRTQPASHWLVLLVELAVTRLERSGAGN